MSPTADAEPPGSETSAAGLETGSDGVLPDLRSAFCSIAKAAVLLSR